MPATGDASLAGNGPSGVCEEEVQAGRHLFRPPPHHLPPHDLGAGPEAAARSTADECAGERARRCGLASGRGALALPARRSNPWRGRTKTGGAATVLFSTGLVLTGDPCWRRLLGSKCTNGPKITDLQNRKCSFIGISVHDLHESTLMLQKEPKE